MGELGGFLKLHRVGFAKRDPGERVRDYNRYYDVQPATVLREQGARCMDCGIPFCHEGCPLGNLIPDWNDLVYRGMWREALDQLHLTNNFPEFTGAICPAPCESACVLAINTDPVTIEQIELAIAERAWEEGWIVPAPPPRRSGRTVAVVGSGPAGLAVAAQLNQAGHEVTIFERDEGPGGLMRFGVPDVKLPKRMIDRRVAVMEEEGVSFRYGADVGRDVTTDDLCDQFDAVVLATGSRVHRDIEVPGRELDGVHFAMEYLYQRNRHVAKLEDRPYRETPENQVISAEGRRVVVIGGGDTGMDCISNANREGAVDVQMLDVYQELPPTGRDPRAPWPLPPKRTLTTYALEEGGTRMWGTEVTAFDGEDGRLKRVHARQVEGTSSRDLKPVPGSEFTVDADIALLAIGFLHPEHEGPISDLGLDLDARGNVRAPVFTTSRENVFACGDARTGQSLVVTAIAEGRKCARIVNRALGGSPMDADREMLAAGPVARFTDHSLRAAGMAAGTVRVGDDFFSGPGSD
jgi:glutamate synthase (NADPH/NADH) small chain